MNNRPFKMLDSYRQEDFDRFFGRDKETAQLYNAVFSSNLTLLYGGSGTGKTSLVDCGLRNSFFDTDWLPLFIRRGDHLIKSLEEALYNAQKPGKTKLNRVAFKKLSIQEQVRQLYRDYYRPVYLIFDQFEELFISGKPDEQGEFYQKIADLLASGLQAKVVLIFREEWIAHLNEFEKIVPSLFENRLRIEKMSEQQLLDVIEGTIDHADIELMEPEGTLEAILAKLRDKTKGVELANLQIYLDKLYRNDLARMKEEGKNRKIRFDPQLVKDSRQIEDVLSDFLEEQLELIEEDLKTQKGVTQKGLPMDLLYALVTDDGTKRSLSTDELKIKLSDTDKPESDNAVYPELIDYCIQRFNQLRIIRILSED